MKSKRITLLSIALLFVTFYFNIWSNYVSYDDFSESLVIGRMIRSKTNGVFSEAGFPGWVIYKPPPDSIIQPFSEERITAHNQYTYIDSKNVPTSFELYKSQSGAEVWLYSFINNTLPFKMATNFKLCVALVSLLAALMLSLFIYWANKNFGLIPSLTVLIFSLLSPWMSTFAHNTWWTLWTPYLPFITTLMLIQKEQSDGFISNIRFYGFIFLSVFVKCLFSGFEYMTSVLLTIFIPLIYFSILKRKTLYESLKRLILTGSTAVLATIAEMGILISQHKILVGTFRAGIDYIIFSFHKRTSGFEAIKDRPGFATVKNGVLSVIKMYLGNNAFGWMPFKVHFLYLIIVIFIVLATLYYHRRVLGRKYFALAVATLISIVAPLSWLIIFKQHAVLQQNLDYIVWYIPFLLYGFLCVGVLIDLLVDRKLTFSTDETTIATPIPSTNDSKF